MSLVKEKFSEISNSLVDKISGNWYVNTQEYKHAGFWLRELTIGVGLSGPPKPAFGESSIAKEPFKSGHLSEKGDPLRKEERDEERG